MRDKQLDCLFVAHQEVRLLHIKVVEQVPYAIAAVKRATHDVIDAEPRLPVVNRIGQPRV
jgi:hypothetical protein